MITAFGNFLDHRRRRRCAAWSWGDWSLLALAALYAAGGLALMISLREPQNVFLKILFDDAGTVGVMVVVITAEVFLAASGEVALAQIAIPWLVPAGTGWLATR
jgi:hypothetical protein